MEKVLLSSLLAASFMFGANDISNLETQINQLTSKPNYQKYLYATIVERKFQTIYWYDTIKCWRYS